MEVARMAVKMNRGEMNASGALTLTDDRVLHVEFDPQEMARIQQAEAKLDELTQRLGNLGDIVRSRVEGMLDQTRAYAEAFQRGVPVEQVEMGSGLTGLHFAINLDGKKFDLNAREWQYDKQEAQNFIQALEQMKKGGTNP